MEGFDDCHTKLLYTIYKLHRQSRISDEAKDALKAKVILDNPSIMQVCQRSLKHNDAEHILEELVEHLAKPLRKRPTGLEVPGKVSPVSEEDSSPLGNFLNKRKREHTEEHHFTSRSIIRPMQVMQD